MTTFAHAGGLRTSTAGTAGASAAVPFRVRELAPCNLLSMHAANPDRYPFFLESAASGTAQGRFDILFAFPEGSLHLEVDGTLSHVGLKTNRSRTPDFLVELDRWWQRCRTEDDVSDLPFTGGWFICLGYELAGQVEPTLRLHRPAAGPVAACVRIPAAVLWDHKNQRCVAVVESGRENLLEILEKDANVARQDLPPAHSPVLDGPLTEEPPDRYLAAIEQTRRYIVDGDIFQANLSREWSGRVNPGVPSSELYRRLRSANPGPFAGLAVFDDMTVISSSPERLLQIRGNRVQTRPIAGTRPRGSRWQQDLALSRELIAHPKERAEHIMLIDLERNDLGRICRAGSIEVNEMMVVESYTHVHHIVSNVQGRLRAGMTPGKSIRAVFPGGTITGCPKVRCMEIINELEPAARGAYTGSMGYLNRNGSLDLNILIRTIVRHGDELTLRAGGGIVADSDPVRELEETRAKAKGLIAALAGGCG